MWVSIEFDAHCFFCFLRPVEYPFRRHVDPAAIKAAFRLAEIESERLKTDIILMLLLMMMTMLCFFVNDRKEREREKEKRRERGRESDSTSSRGNDVLFQLLDRAPSSSSGGLVPTRSVGDIPDRHTHTHTHTRTHTPTHAGG